MCEEEQGRGYACACLAGMVEGWRETAFSSPMLGREGRDTANPETPRRSDVIMFFTVELTGQIPKESQELKLVLGKQVRGSFPNKPTELRPTCMSNF